MAASLWLRDDELTANELDRIPSGQKKPGLDQPEVLDPPPSRILKLA
jgi:hypothetical protein